ncbi:bacterial low temperature requirement A protein-domain-containing protein [Umbelopsis sp. AD052]|nr:bacterial low temperature requirement A protein-domain-containing protein [Umbelopsis sp. AD052]
MNQNNGVSLRGMPSKKRKNRHHKQNQDHPDHSEKPTDTQSNEYSSEERGLARGSAIGSSNSPLSSQLESTFDTPMQYDSTGKPIVAHGNETFGDIMLHPTQQYHLHKQRMEKYKLEVDAWETEKVGEKPMPVPIGIQSGDVFELRSVIHFRRLIGDQTIKMTDELAASISKELDFSPDDLKELSNVKNTDALAKLIRKSGHELSIRVHNSEDVHPEGTKTPAKSPELEEKNPLDGHHYPLGEQPVPSPAATPEAATLAVPPVSTPVSTPKQQNLSASNVEQPPPQQRLNSDASSGNEKDRRKSTDSERAHLAAGSAIIHLNENVYLEVKKIIHEDLEDKFEESAPKRRAFFMIPDPDLSDEIGEESSASWLELFGDVFYVGWLTTFTHHNHIVNGSTLANYVGWFVVMWWSWCSSALYSSRYDTGDVVHHIYKAIELCSLVGMAGASNTYSSENHFGFVLGYIVSKAVLMVEYSVVLAVAVITGSHGKKPLAAYVAVNMLSIILWGVSLIFPGDDQRGSRFALWYVSILIELLVNVAMKKNKQVSVAGSHLAERFGLFTLIILGENLMGFITLVSEASSDDIKLICANMMGVICIFGFFFMCFDDFSAQVLLEVNVSQLWMYLHFPLHLCQVAMGIALQDVIHIYGEHWDYLGVGCSANTEAGVEVAAVSNTTTQLMVNASGRALSLLQALTMEAPAEGGATASSESSSSAASEAEECLNIDFVFKTFLISAGLVLILNALIKLINTPVNSRWSKYICASRAINAILFFGLTQAVHRINSIGLLGLLTGCLLFQSAVDLLD